MGCFGYDWLLLAGTKILHISLNSLCWNALLWVPISLICKVFCLSNKGLTFDPHLYQKPIDELCCEAWYYLIVFILKNCLYFYVWCTWHIFFPIYLRSNLDTTAKWSRFHPRGNVLMFRMYQKVLGGMRWRLLL